MDMVVNMDFLASQKTIRVVVEVVVLKQVDRELLINQTQHQEILLQLVEVREVQGQVQV